MIGAAATGFVITLAAVPARTIRQALQDTQEMHILRPLPSRKKSGGWHERRNKFAVRWQRLDHSACGFI
jgi:hypothetical protein